MTEPSPSVASQTRTSSGSPQRSHIAQEEKAAIAGDIREVYSEAKSTGFETKIMRQVVRLRKMEAHDREEQEQLLDLYKRAVGLVG